MYLLLTFIKLIDKKTLFNISCNKHKMRLSKTFSKFLKGITETNGLNNSKIDLKNMRTTNETSIFRTITNDDILQFAKLTGDHNIIHSGSANNLVHGALLNGLVSGVIGTKMPGPGTIVVEQNLQYPKPCYAGDKIEIKVQIVSMRKIITCEYTCIANGEKVVLKGNAKLIKKL